MSILSSIYKHALARVLPLSPDTRDDTTNHRKRKFNESTDKESISRRRKRDDSDYETEVITKRRRVDNDHFAPIVDGEAYESTAISGQQAVHDDGANKREMMPPPALSASKVRSINKIIREQSNKRASLNNNDAGSLISANTRGAQHRVSDEFINEYDMEKARRHAAATTLPPNSGVWERSEKELFFHLSYRGFEPLFPANWMRDFRTMPLSLYHQPSDEQPPLIQHHKLGEFRAIRELRELLDLGKNVRDRFLSSPGVKREGVIERATNKYIAWAIRDVGVKLAHRNTNRPRSDGALLPIHVVIKLKAHQTTTDCLVEMKTKLHRLAADHRRARNIHDSIERDQLNYSTPDPEDETRIAESLEDDLPVLYGIMICKSVLAVFTLNSRTPPPARGAIPTRGFTRSDRHQSPTPSKSAQGAAKESAISDANKQIKRGLVASIPDELDEYDSVSDPRFISDFDFSDSSKDVWNALVIAIIAMQIRRDLILYQNRELDSCTNEEVHRGIEDMDIDENDDDDDPDA